MRFHVLLGARKGGVVCLALALAIFAFGSLARLVSSAEPVIVAEPAGRDQVPNRTRDGRLHEAVLMHAGVAERRQKKYPMQPVSLATDAGGSVLAYPPFEPSRRALTVVYLHGIHGKPENGCPWFREGAGELGWLVCPAANASLGNGTFSWAGPASTTRAVVARAERAAQQQGAEPDAPGVLVGFSQGVWVALDLVRAGLGRYRGLVLLAGDAEPKAEDLVRAGISRLVLGAGERDATFAPMKRTAERLAREGIETRFVSLGPIGHTYMTEQPEKLRDAIAWVGSAAGP